MNPEEELCLFFPDTVGECDVKLTKRRGNGSLDDVSWGILSGNLFTILLVTPHSVLRSSYLEENVSAPF